MHLVVEFEVWQETHPVGLDVIADLDQVGITAVPIGKRVPGPEDVLRVGDHIRLG
jgi:hypothetical protein